MSKAQILSKQKFWSSSLFVLSLALGSTLEAGPPIESLRDMATRAYAQTHPVNRKEDASAYLTLVNEAPSGVISPVMHALPNRSLAHLMRFVCDSADVSKVTPLAKALFNELNVGYNLFTLSLSDKGQIMGQHPRLGREEFNLDALLSRADSPSFKADIDLDKCGKNEKFLSRLQGLRIYELKLRAKGTTSAQLSHFFKAGWTQLISLAISDNDIGDDGVIALAKSTTLSSLLNLELWKNKISYQGAQAIAESKNFRNLKHLELQENNISAKGAIAIAESTILQNLLSLTLWENNIRSEGAIAIAKSKTLQKLQKLDLSNNDIGDDGVIALAKGTRLQNLESLKLWGNNISSKGAIAIAESTSLQNLLSLELFDNNICADGATAIAESKTLNHLKELDLSDNGIGKDGVIAIKKSPNLPNLHTFKHGDPSLR